MKIITKLKKLMVGHELTMTLNEDNVIEMIITNKETQVSFIVSGSSWTQCVNEAFTHVGFKVYYNKFYDNSNT